MAPILELVKKRAEASRENAELYISKSFPLSFVARLVGGNAAGFAQYVKSLGVDIVSCIGTQEERDAAVKLAIRHRENGVVLDEYTLWVAAEANILQILRLWFGQVLVPQSVIDAVDDLIRS